MDEQAVTCREVGGVMTQIDADDYSSRADGEELRDLTACNQAITEYGRRLGLHNGAHAAEFSRCCTAAALAGAEAQEAPLAFISRALKTAAEAGGIAPRPADEATLEETPVMSAEVAEALAATSVLGKEFVVPEPLPRSMPAHPLGELLPVVQPQLWRQRIVGALAGGWTLVVRALRSVT